LILRKISEFDATRCEILWIKCTKFDFRWGSGPDPAGELTALPRAGLSERGALARFGCQGDAEREPIRGSGGRAPAGSRGRAPGQGFRGQNPLKLKGF